MTLETPRIILGIIATHKFGLGEHTNPGGIDSLSARSEDNELKAAVSGFEPKGLAMPVASLGPEKLGASVA